jgi:acyl carrier protein
MSKLPPDAPVLDRVREIICELFLHDPAQVHAESLLIGELDVDSIGFLDLAFTIEDRFGLVFPDLKTDAQLIGMPLPEALRRLEQDPAAATTLFGYVKAEAIRHAAGGAVPADAAAREELLARQTFGDLARAVGLRIPADLEAATSVSDVRLAQVFRAITVGTVAHYVEYLIAERDAGSSPAS